MKINFMLLVCFITCAYTLNAQENCKLSLSGQIIDEHDSSALGFSNLWLLKENRGVSADINGFYRLDNLCSGRHDIVVSHIGCENDTIVIEITRSMEFNFKLEHHTEMLLEVQIEGLSKSGNILEKKQLLEEDFYENSGKSFGELLTEINGVNSFKTGSNISKPMISGFSGNRVQIMNQGIQHQSQQWGSEHAPEIDPFAASKYSVIKGAGAVKYSSGAIGGLIIVEPDPLNRILGLNGEVNALYATNNRMGNTSIMLEGKSKLLQNFYWRMQGSLKRSGNIKTPNYYQKNTGMKEYNGSIHLGYFENNWSALLDYSQFNSEIGIFSGAHIGNLTDLENVINQTEPRPEDQEGFSYEIRRPYQRIIHESVKGELNYYLLDGKKLNFKFSRQFNIREEFDKDLPRNDALAALNIPELSLSLESYSANLNYDFTKGDYWQFETGLQYINKRNSVNSFTDFIPDYTQALYSGFFLVNYQKRNNSLEFGTRVEQNEMVVNKLTQKEYQLNTHRFTTLTLNLGYRYDFDAKSSLKSNITYASRAPEINELYSDGLHHGSASLEFGNSNLKNEESIALSSSYLFKNQRWNYEAYVYAQYIRDFIYLEPQGLELTIRGAYPSYQWSSTDALIRGFDQTVSYTISKHWEAINKFSLLWGNNILDDNYLINMPSNRIESELQFRTSINRTAKDEFQIKVGHQFVAMQNRYNEEQEFLKPPSSYHLFSAAASYRILMSNKKGKEQSLEFALRLDNAFNQVYRDYLNRFRLFTDEQGRNLTLRINYKY